MYNFQEKLNSEKFNNLDVNPKIGDFVVSKISTNGRDSKYRAQVTSVSQDEKFDVFFIDFVCKHHNLKANQFYKLPKKFDIENQSLFINLIKLNNVENIDINKHLNIISQFSNCLCKIKVNSIGKSESIFKFIYSQSDNLHNSTIR